MAMNECKVLSVELRKIKNISKCINGWTNHLSRSVGVYIFLSDYVYADNNYHHFSVLLFPSSLLSLLSSHVVISKLTVMCNILKRITLK